MVVLGTARLRAILELRFTADRRSLALNVESLATCKAGDGIAGVLGDQDRRAARSRERLMKEMG